MANSFQSEVRSALDEPMTELRGTADAIRDATSFTGDAKTGGRAKPARTSPIAGAVPGPDPDPDRDSDLDLEPELEPDQAAITDVLEGDDDDDDQGSDDDLITRTLSGDVEPPSPSDTHGPDS
jgi:hypothetical protein